MEQPQAEDLEGRNSQEALNSYRVQNQAAVEEAEEVEDHQPALTSYQVALQVYA